MDEFVEGVELLTDEALCIEETRDDRPAILLCYLLVVLVSLFVPHFVSSVGISILIVGVRVLNWNEIKRVRRHMNMNKDQYTPWLIRAILTGGSDYDVAKTMVFLFFPAPESTLQIGHRGLEAGDATLGPAGMRARRNSRADCTSFSGLFVDVVYRPLTSRDFPCLTERE